MTGVGDLDEVTLDLEVDGEEVRRTVGRRTWERGGWATIAIAYEERSKGGEWVRKVALLRMKRVHEAWVKHAAITLSDSEAQAVGVLGTAS